MVCSPWRRPRPLDEPDRAQLEVLRGTSCDVSRRPPRRHRLARARRGAAGVDRPRPRLRRASRGDGDRGDWPGSSDASSLREAAVATLACPRSHEPTELESLAVGLAGAIVDGTCGAAPVLRRVLSGPHDAPAGGRVPLARVQGDGRKGAVGPRRAPGSHDGASRASERRRCPLGAAGRAQRGGQRLGAGGGPGRRWLCDP